MHKKTLSGINQESRKMQYFVYFFVFVFVFCLQYLQKKFKLLAFFNNLFKSMLNMRFFNIIDINSKNMFMLIIEINNFKFNRLRLRFSL